MNKFLLLLGFVAIVAVSCSKDDNNENDNEKEPEDPKEQLTPLFASDSLYTLNFFHIPSLGAQLGNLEEVFQDSLTSNDVVFEDFDFPADWNFYTTYNLESDNSPFKKYDIRADYQRYFDYKNKKYTDSGLANISIKCTEMNTDRFTMEETFQFFADRFGAMRNIDSLRYVAYNEDIEYYENGTSAADVVAAIQNPNKDVNGQVSWQNVGYLKMSECGEGCPADLVFKYNAADSTATIKVSAYYAADTWKAFTSKEWSKY